MASTVIYQIIRTEIDADPLVRGYAGMTDIQIANSLNVVSRPGRSTVDQLRTYFLLERKSGSFLYGRLAIVGRSQVGDDPINEATVLTLDHIAAALTMLNILNPVSEFSLDLADSRFDALLNDLAGGAGAKVLAGSDKDNIQAFSLNTISRGVELGAGTVLEGDVNYAKGLP